MAGFHSFLWLSNTPLYLYVCVCVCMYIKTSQVAQMVRICLQSRRPRFDPWVRQIPWRRKWQPIPVTLPGELHGQRNQVGYSLWDLKETPLNDTTFTFINVCVCVCIYMYTTFSLSIHLSEDIEVVSMYWLLWVIMQWTWKADISLKYWFHFLWISIQQWDCWNIWSFYF